MIMVNMSKLSDLLLPARIHLRKLLLENRADAQIVEMIRDDFQAALRAQGRRLNAAQKRRLVQDILQGYMQNRVARQKIVSALESIYQEILRDKKMLPITPAAQAYILQETAKDLLEEMLERLSSNKPYVVTRNYLSYIPAKFSGKKP
jgi:hypothetical protein